MTTRFDEVRSAAAARRTPPKADAIDVLGPTYIAVMTDQDYRSAAVQIGTTEDWWILDQIFQQPQRDDLIIYAEDFDAAYQIYPSTNPLAQKLLNLKLAESRPDGIVSAVRDDGLELSVLDAIGNPILTPMVEALCEFLDAREVALDREPLLFTDQQLSQSEVRYQPRLPGVDGPVSKAA
jgi:hypothetical protein